ncbi:MAG: nucleotidyltransferase [Bacilli bacterium]|nr:nucleotidyltransferase [Bacilli bacterium]
MVGIIAEYNPFHNGHLYHLNKVKEMFPDKTITLILVGNFLNRGDVSIIDKFDKTKLALKYGVDLVVELPFIFATQSADTYAFGAISLLNNLNCEYLVFGSESNDLEKLYKIAQYQINNEIDIKKYLKQGYNYPTSLSKVLEEETNLKIDTPNDLLAISYIKAILKLNSNIKPISIQRTNDYHSLDTNTDIISASSIRNLLKENKDISKYVPIETLKYIRNISIEKYFDILKHQIIIDDLSKYQDIDETLESLFKKHITNSNSIEELINSVKSKNYTYNKIKRCLIHILCGYTKQNCNIEYIRILGFNKKGQEYLNKIKKDIKLPILTNFKPILNYELQVDKIYSLITDNEILKKELNGPIID